MRKLFLVLLLIVLLAAGALWWLLRSPLSPPGETFVEIEPGSSSTLIAKQLEQAGVIRSRFAFLAARLTVRGKLRAGEYRFINAATPADIYNRIVHGDVYTIPVTVPEGSSLYDIAARCEAAHLFPAAVFLAAAHQDAPLIGDLDPGANSLEGYLFPDTYLVPRHITADQMVHLMVRRFRLAARTLGISGPMHRVVVLASLIERETPIAAERPLVASVFVNRLAKGMPLMTDPAVIYGLQIAGRWRGSIYASDLAFDTPYNTYIHAGLPPGPVSNPGIASLRAAAHPALTDYLYFVAASADPEGHSRFAATLEEHNRNVAAYRRAERAVAQPPEPVAPKSAQKQAGRKHPKPASHRKQARG